MADQFLDGDPVHDGDQLFVLGEGVAKVIEVRPTKMLLKVGGRTKKYNFQGIADGRTFRTLYWFDPVLVVPRKKATSWAAQKQMLMSVTRQLGALFGTMTPIDDVDLTGLTLHEMLMRGMVTPEQVNEATLANLKLKLSEAQS